MSTLWQTLLALIAYAAKKDMTLASDESVLLQREEGQDDTAELRENVQGVIMQGI